MIVRVGTAPRARGLGYAEFQEHWRTEHGALAGSLPGLRGYVQNHAVLDGGRPLLPYVGFDACSELEFDSLAAMDEAFASEHYRREVAADEQALIDKTRFAMLLAERRVLADAEPPPGAVKLLTFLPLDPRSSRERLAAVLAGPYREAVGQAAPVRHEQLLELPGAHEGRLAALWPAVDVLWFASVEAALEALVGEAGQRAAYELAGASLAPARLLATPIRVV